MRKIFLPFLVTLLFPTILFAKLPSKLIDTPINSFYSQDEFAVDFTVYRDGGVVTWLEMGIKPGFNLGFSVDFYKMIGEDSMKTRPPRLSARVRVYRGDFFLPAFTIGYLGQGYGRYHDGNYENEEKGFYVALEREVWIPNLIWNAGLNIADFKKADLYGFFNVRYLLFNKLLLSMEYDNIRRTPNSRLNLGFRYFITDNLSMGLGLRKLNKLDQGIERILQIVYVGDFNILGD
ncbi:hypothetical protein ACFL5N_00460 [bacterium]